MAQKISQLAQDLKPYILPWIAAANRGGGSSSGGSVAAHDFSLHTGTIADAQAPQFLLRDGTRSLTGNLSVTAGVTIDGVDISAHVLDANAHHDQATAGTGISVAGQVISLAAGVAGAGLAHAAGVLSVNVTDGLAISGDNVILASSAAGAGLAYASGVLSVNVTDGLALSGDNVILASGAAGAGLAYASGVLSVNAGNGLLLSGDNVAVGVANTGATGLTVEADAVRLTSSSNPGAAAAILASTASGGLTLQSLTVAGNVDITSGGDLTVGVNLLFVDVSQLSVGINGAPDPQFALDVYGPARAEYWIGPHALQIKNALLIAHYDGRQPFETNFTGETNGHMGQVATVAGGVIWREGKFNKAVQLGEATTNLVTNPSFETGTTGWSLNNASGTCSAAQTALYNHSGIYSVRLANSTSGANDFYSFNVTGLTLSTVYTISAWYRAVTFTAGAASNYGLVAYDTDNQGATIQTTTITAATEGWVRKSVTVTTTATGGSHTIQIRLYAPNGYVAWDSVQVEQKAYATPYCDGSLGGYSAGGVANGTGHAWSGTAHASTSSRLAANLNYPTSGSLGLFTGTVAAWINLAALSTSNMHIFRADGTSAGYIMLRVTTGGVLQGYWGTAAATDATVLSTGTWHHVAMTYDGATVRLYVNGQAGATGASTGFSGMPTAMYAGNTAGSGQLNGLLDDLLITSDCKVADEILAIYESNAPVFAETAKYGFRTTSIGLIWADDEGLWGRNVLGQPIIGLYGGEAATKSWGGLTLASGDLLIGDSSRYGYLYWDDSAATLTLAGSFKALSGATQYASLDTLYGLSFLRDQSTVYTPWSDPERSISWHTAFPTTNANTTAAITSYEFDYGGGAGYSHDLVIWSSGNGTTRDAGIILRADASSPGATTEISAGINIYSYADGSGSDLEISATNITITGDVTAENDWIFNTGGSATFLVPVVINENAGSTQDFRAESATEANMLFLDASANTLYLGGTTNGIAIEKGGIFSFIAGGTGKIKDGTNIPLDTTTGTKIGTGTTQKLGFWNATPIVRPSAYTQTYSTATRTHNNLTYAAPAAYGAGANGYSTAAMAAAVHAAVIALAADLTNLKQVVNALIDDHQAMGLAG